MISYEFKRFIYTNNYPSRDFASFNNKYLKKYTNFYYNEYKSSLDEILLKDDNIEEINPSSGDELSRFIYNLNDSKINDLNDEYHYQFIILDLNNYFSSNNELLVKKKTKKKYGSLRLIE